MTEKPDITLQLDGTRGADGVRKSIIGFIEARAKVHELRFTNSNARHEIRRVHVHMAEELRYVVKVLQAAEVTSENRELSDLRKENHELKDLLVSLEAAVSMFRDGMAQSEYEAIKKTQEARNLAAMMVLTQAYFDRNAT